MLQRIDTLLHVEYHKFMKTCHRCKISKDLLDFSKKSASKDGYYHTCKSCKALVDKDYRNRNKEYLKEKSINYRENNKEIISIKKRNKYHSASAEEVKLRAAKKREYNQNSPDAVKQRKREHDKNYFASPRGREVLLHSIRKRKAQKVSSTDNTVTYLALKELMEAQNYCCKYCATDLRTLKKSDVHLDHVYPLSKGGIHSITNVVWSCAPCNQKKTNKILQ